MFRQVQYYSDALRQPQGLYIKKISRSRREGTGGDYSHVLEGIEHEIRHFHSLGLVYNDVNSSNIMTDEDGTPVIIDFGSVAV